MSEKILIALGDPSLSEDLSKKLAGKGYKVETVISGKDVLSKASSSKPDLILLDILLPDKNGYEVLTEKILNKDTSEISVIVMSNGGNPIQMNKIPETPSIKDYIIKTHITSDEVMDKIEKAFGREVVKEGEGSEIKVTKKDKKILWVEDDRLLGNILSKKFESSGYDLLKATTGPEAFAILEKDIPHLIVLDILLPEMNGFDVLQKIKINESWKNIPIIMLSNLSKQSDIEKAKQLGANRFIVKAAVSLDEIIAEVENLTGSKKLV